MIYFWKVEMMRESHSEFTAHYLADISKAIIAVGLASKLFIDLPTWLRITLATSGVGLFIMAYFIHPGDKT